MHHVDGAVARPKRWPWQRDTLAFGWLDREHAFRQGACPPQVVAHLEQAARNPVDRTRGYHACLFCPPREVPADQPWAMMGPTPYETGTGDVLQLGSASIEVEAGGQRWVAPNLVLHYITEHDYLPPDEVVHALT
ncbi:MAG TPA: hypothetical protein GXZ45_10000 [Propionibacterium sp.]|nr:hypothetical protein [Propionibacterium sp.]